MTLKSSIPSAIVDMMCSQSFNQQSSTQAILIWLKSNRKGKEEKKKKRKKKRGGGGRVPSASHVKINFTDILLQLKTYAYMPIKQYAVILIPTESDTYTAQNDPQHNYKQ